MRTGPREIAALRRLTGPRADRAEAALAQAAARRAACEAEVAALTAAPPPAADPAGARATDRWQAWRRTALDAARARLALARASEEEARRAAGTARGRDEALAKLEDRAKAERRRIAAGRKTAASAGDPAGPLPPFRFPGGPDR